MKKLVNWIKKFENLNGHYPDAIEILFKANTLIQEKENNKKKKNKK